MIYLNLGRREVGKTTLGLYLISKSSRRVVFDPRGLVPTGRIRAGTPEEIDRWFRLEPRPVPDEVVVTPEGDVRESFEMACLWVKECLKAGETDLAFLIDELRFVPDPDTVNDLNWILRCATRESVVVVFTAHRPADVSTDIRSISDVWCVFHMTQEHDLKVIAERCSPAVAQRVARLAPRHFIAWNDAVGKMTAHTHPDRWFVPLRATSAIGTTIGVQPIDALDGDLIPPSSSRFDFFS
jgi:hypothetical protein